MDTAGQSALHQAVWDDQVATGLTLIERGANVHALDTIGGSSLHLAAWRGHVDSCLMLLQYGGDPLAENKNNQNALQVAINQQERACANVIKSWIAAGAARTALKEIAAGSGIKK